MYNLWHEYATFVGPVFQNIVFRSLYDIPCFYVSNCIATECEYCRIGGSQDSEEQIHMDKHTVIKVVANEWKDGLVMNGKQII